MVRQPPLRGGVQGLLASWPIGREVIED